jgi:hypothetical protein
MARDPELSSIMYPGGSLRASSHRFQKLASEDGLVAAPETSVVDDDAHHVATELEERCS